MKTARRFFMKKLSKSGKIAIIVICSILLAFGAGVGLFHLGLYIKGVASEIHLDDMAVEDISSIREFNNTSETYILNFGTIDCSMISAKTYEYEGDVVFIEESSILFGVRVDLLVVYTENTYGRHFGQDYKNIFGDKYIPDRKTAPFEDVEGQRIQRKDGKTYLSYATDSHYYYLVVHSTEDIWKDILGRLLGDE